MKKRATIVVLIVVAFLLLAPLIMVDCRTRWAASVRESLLVSLRERYPDHVFEEGAANWIQPYAAIRVLTPVDPAAQEEIEKFVQAEKDKLNFEGRIHLYFMADKKDAQREPEH